MGISSFNSRDSAEYSFMFNSLLQTYINKGAYNSNNKLLYATYSVIKLNFIVYQYVLFAQCPITNIM